MAFNNLTFNVSKSTPTTSTTNANSTSSPSSTTENTPTSTSQKPTFLQDMLSKNNADRKSPKFVGSAVSEAAPAVVTKGDENSQATAHSQPAPKKDLIELFDKFDLKGNAQPPHDDDDIEHKFDQFKPNRKLSIEKSNSELESVEASEVIQEKHLEASPIIETIESGPPASSSFSQQTIPDLERSDDAANPDENDILNSNTDIEEQPVETPAAEPLIEADSIEADPEASGDPVAETIPQHSPVESSIPLSSVSEPQPLVPTDSPSHLVDVPDPAPQSTEVLSKRPISEDITEETGEEASPMKSEDNYLQQIPQAGEGHSQHNWSSKPFDFHIFLQHLKKKSADPIVRYIRSFLVSFNKQSHTFTLQQKVKIVRDFKSFMNDKFNVYEPFASMNDAELENSREGLEKLVMNRIYSHCFPPEIAKNSTYVHEMVATDLNEDKQFTRQLDKYEWINGHHLDVDLEKLTNLRTHTTEELNFMEYATQEINKINNYRAPRDKIICILNACKIIYGFLRVNNQETNADAFIPILIMIIIKAKVKHIVSNIHYIENFRGEEWLAFGETAYYLSSLQAAISFIGNIGCNDLSISRDEYDAHMEAWAANDRVKRELEETAPISIQQPTPQHAQEPQVALSPSSVLLTSAEMFTKSISNFLSPSPQESPSPQPHSTSQNFLPPGDAPPQVREEPPDQRLIDQTFDSLKEIFPNLDYSIMKDIVIMNKGEMEPSLDACLQLVGDT